MEEIQQIEQIQEIPKKKINAMFCWPNPDGTYNEMAVKVRGIDKDSFWRLVRKHKVRAWGRDRLTLVEHETPWTQYEALTLTRHPVTEQELPAFLTTKGVKQPKLEIDLPQDWNEDRP
jgi:hypothetical protein